MKRTNVALNFLKLPIPTRIIFYRSVVGCLLGNAYFLIPSISLDVATAAIDALETASIASQDGSHINIAIRNNAEKAVNEIFRNLASYVEFTSLGDEMIIISSGFSPTKQPVISIKEIITAVHGSHSGAIKISTPSQDRVYSHEWRMRKVSTTGVVNPWTHITTTTQCSYEVTGLEVSATYEFAVANVTPDGVSDYCPPVSIIVI
jgi:hypothetical protein